MALAPAAARAEGQCRILDIGFQPATPDNPNNKFAPQIVAWVEDTAGNFVETAYITWQTGTFGIGNRPGRFDFDSGPLWPYGRRETVFPVWATKQPLRWPQLEFQDGDDNDLSHSMGESSPDKHFCRPMLPSEFDAMTCPSANAYSDKGTLSATKMSRYPPRNDLSAQANGDTPSVGMFAALNPFDAISQPTPVSGMPAHVSWAVPFEVPPGDYVLWVEVSKEFDMNATYNEQTYPSPPNLAWAEYGSPYRGQPSVLYRVPFTMNNADTTASTDVYAGYGDPDGLDGNVRAPDTTISNTPGSGAGRLALVSSDGVTSRVHLTLRHEIDVMPPASPGNPEVTAVTGSTASIAFAAPGDDGATGMVAGYEVRFRVGEPITEDNFSTSTLLAAEVSPVASGEQQTIALQGLLPETTYSVGIRAFDNCRNASPLSIVEVVTPDRQSGEVNACFIATAAYGSVMASDVELLRHFRDSLMAKTVLGELAIETYYTFSPPLAGVVGESDLLRATARRLLAPIVSKVRETRW
ncbi:MAG: Fibronectin type domain protein [Deltaproteobacteria bacterium]|nr:Fibronectin type domain protein [Deltaproteobacteria bacterium]